MSLWSIVKLVVSLLAGSFAAVALLLFSADLSRAALLGMAGVFLFLAAWPWINPVRPTRALGLVAVVMSFGLLFVASRPFTKASEYPLTCAGQRTWCEIENALFAVGGPALAALPFAILGVGALVLSIGAVLRLWHER